MSKANITPTSGDTTPKTRDSAEGMETYNDDSKSEKPPLTVEDLRFDYDRSQLRDSRAMPGREARPYYGKLDDMPVALLEHLKETRSVYKSERPKGRLTNAITDDMFVVEARHNPWEMFYHLYQCYDKGREGSPTCDSAGFQLDYDQVWCIADIAAFRECSRRIESSLRWVFAKSVLTTSCTNSGRSMLHRSG